MIDRLIAMSHELARECGDGNFEAYLPRPAYEKLYCDIASRNLGKIPFGADHRIHSGYLGFYIANHARVIVRQITGD